MNIEKWFEDNAITIFLFISLGLLFVIIIIPTHISIGFTTLIIWISAFAFSLCCALYLVSKEYSKIDDEKQKEKQKRGEA